MTAARMYARRGRIRPLLENEWNRTHTRHSDRQEPPDEHDRFTTHQWQATPDGATAPFVDPARVGRRGRRDRLRCRRPAVGYLYGAVERRRHLRAWAPGLRQLRRRVQPRVDLRRGTSQ